MWSSVSSRAGLSGVAGACDSSDTVTPPWVGPATFTSRRQLCTASVDGTDRGLESRCSRMNRVARAQLDRGAGPLVPLIDGGPKTHHSMPVPSEQLACLLGVNEDPLVEDGLILERAAA